MSYNSVIDRTDAGALIPEEVAGGIIQAMPEASLALTAFRQVRMSRGQLRMPVMSALASAYWVAGDIGLKRTADVTWANKTLTAEEIAVIVPIPEAVLDDADFDIWAEVRPRLVEAFGRVLDEAVLFGVNKPASFPDAIVTGAVASGNFLARQAQSATNDLSIEISNTMALVEADGFVTNGYMARNPLRGELRGLRDQNRNVIYQEGAAGVAKGSPRTLYGDPLWYSSNGAWPTTGTNIPQLITGDFSQAILGIRQEITYKILTEAVIQDNTGAIIYNLAQQDMVALRAVMRVGYQVANPVTALGSNSATRYPFAVLRNST